MKCFNHLEIFSFKPKEFEFLPKITHGSSCASFPIAGHSTQSPRLEMHVWWGGVILAHGLKSYLTATRQKWPSGGV